MLLIISKHKNPTLSYHFVILLGTQNQNDVILRQILKTTNFKEPSAISSKIPDLKALARRCDHLLHSY